MPAVIHSDQGREIENNLMQELCLLCGADKTGTTPYHPASDGLVEWLNRTLLMMLAMFAGEHRDDWDDLLLAVMMAYRSSVHKSTRFSLYRLMFGEECTLPMDVGLPRRTHDVPDPISMPYGSGMLWKLPRGLVSWICMDSTASSPMAPVVDAGTVYRSAQGPPPLQYRMFGRSSLFSGFRHLHNILQCRCRMVRQFPRKPRYPHPEARSFCDTG